MNNKENFKKSLKELIWLLIRQFFAWLRAKVDKNYEYLEEYYKTSAKDKEDARDYKFGDYFWDVNALDLPKKVDLFNGEILNQGSTLHCVAYATAHGINENEFYFDKEAEEKWQYATPYHIVNYIRDNLDPNIDNAGTYIQYGPKAAVATWYSEIYVSIASLAEMKRILNLGVAVITGTNQFDWRKTWQKSVAVVGNGWGHAIHIDGYDDDLVVTDANNKKYKGVLIAKNSWWDDWGVLGGRYYIPYELYGNLFNSKYALWNDCNKSKEIENKKNEFADYTKDQKEVLENMKNKGYWNGKEPHNNIERGDVMFILNKVITNNNLK